MNWGISWLQCWESLTVPLLLCLCLACKDFWESPSLVIKSSTFTPPSYSPDLLGRCSLEPDWRELELCAWSDRREGGIIGKALGQCLKNLAKSNCPLSLNFLLFTTLWVVPLKALEILYLVSHIWVVVVKFHAPGRWEGRKKYHHKSELEKLGLEKFY